MKMKITITKVEWKLLTNQPFVDDVSRTQHLEQTLTNSASLRPG